MQELRTDQSQRNPPAIGRLRPDAQAAALGGSARPAKALAAVALLAAAMLAAAFLLSSCGPPAATVEESPLAVAGVPTIRVLLASGVDEATISTTGGYRLRADGRYISQSNSMLPETTLTRDGSLWRLNNLTAAGGSLVLEPAGGSYVRLGRITYRGHLRILPAGAKSLAIVNYVDVESYLAGVLPKELYPSWHSQTYRAQSIAARTFAIYQMSTHGARSDYDLGDTQAWQVYGGFSAETEKSWQAVRSTHGTVLAFGPPNKERIFQSQYSAACGGQVNGAYVLQKSPQIQPLLGGQVCNDCRICPRYRWQAVRVSKSDMLQAIRRSYKAARTLDDVKSINVVSTATNGRAVWVDVVSSSGKSIRLHAEDIRLALIRSDIPQARALYSMNCRINDLGDSFEFVEGRGFGHGVGMCQWGAQAKAARGVTAEEILSFYYPGAKLFRSY